jgi:hypothetical protein
MPLIIFVLYLAGCVVCGIMGRNTTFGFMGHFLLSLIFTPLIDFIIQALGRPSARMLEKILAAKSR